MALIPWRYTQRGFTLLEMLISTIFMVLITAVIVTVSVTMMKVWQASSSRSNGYLATQAALTTLNRDVRNGGYVMTPTPWTQNSSAPYITYYSAAGSPTGVASCVQDPSNSLTYTCTNTTTSATQPHADTAEWQLSSPWVIIYPPLTETQDTYLVTTLNLHINHTPITLDLTNQGGNDPIKEYYISNASGTEGAIGTNLYMRTFTENATTGAVTMLSQETHPLISNVTSMIFNYTGTTGLGAQQQLGLESIALTTTGKQGLFTSVSQVNDTIAIRNSTAITFTAPLRPVFH